MCTASSLIVEAAIIVALQPSANPLVGRMTQIPSKHMRIPDFHIQISSVFNQCLDNNPATAIGAGMLLMLRAMKFDRDLRDGPDRQELGGSARLNQLLVSSHSPRILLLFREVAAAVIMATLGGGAEWHLDLPSKLDPGTTPFGNVLVDKVLLMWSHCPAR